MSETATERWNGSGDLATMLVAVESLTVHPHAARRGDRDAIADSLGRFGQLKPIVAAEDGTILAGNQVYLAAVERLGWSHVAVSRTALDDVGGYLYLVSDNNTSDLAGYDDLEAQVAAEGLAGMAEAIRAQLETETDPSERDRLADQARALEEAAAVLSDLANVATARGGVVNPDDLEAAFRCPAPECAYEWRGHG